ncbi:hypothetical protein OC844_005669, partial [Tilletia horrida]
MSYTTTVGGLSTSTSQCIAFDTVRAAPFAAHQEPSELLSDVYDESPRPSAEYGHARSRNSSLRAIASDRHLQSPRPTFGNLRSVSDVSVYNMSMGMDSSLSSSSCFSTLRNGSHSGQGDVRGLQETLRRVKRKNEGSTPPTMVRRPFNHVRIPSLGLLRNLKRNSPQDAAEGNSPAVRPPLPKQRSMANVFGLGRASTSQPNGLHPLPLRASTERPSIAPTSGHSVLHGIQIIHDLTQRLSTTSVADSRPISMSCGSIRPPPGCARDSMWSRDDPPPPIDADQIEHLLGSPSSQHAALVPAQRNRSSTNSSRLPARVNTASSGLPMPGPEVPNMASSCRIVRTGSISSTTSSARALACHATTPTRQSMDVGQDRAVHSRRDMADGIGPRDPTIASTELPWHLPQLELGSQWTPNRLPVPQLSPIAPGPPLTIPPRPLPALPVASEKVSPRRAPSDFDTSHQPPHIARSGQSTDELLRSHQQDQRPQPSQRPPPPPPPISTSSHNQAPAFAQAGRRGSPQDIEVYTPSVRSMGTTTHSWLSCSTLLSEGGESSAIGSGSASGSHHGHAHTQLRSPSFSASKRALDTGLGLDPDSLRRGSVDVGETEVQQQHHLHYPQQQQQQLVQLRPEVMTLSLPSPLLPPRPRLAHLSAAKSPPPPMMWIETTPTSPHKSTAAAAQHGQHLRLPSTPKSAPAQRGEDAEAGCGGAGRQVPQSA